VTEYELQSKSLSRRSQTTLFPPAPQTRYEPIWLTERIGVPANRLRVPH